MIFCILRKDVVKWINLTIDTEKVGLEKSLDIVIEYLKKRFENKII